MDFIEKILGLAPDGGSGLLEMAMMLVPIVAGAMWALIVYRRTPNARTA